jgi:hypothetical protein
LGNPHRRSLWASDDCLSGYQVSSGYLVATDPRIQGGGFALKAGERGGL